MVGFPLASLAASLGVLGGCPAVPGPPMPPEGKRLEITWLVGPPDASGRERRVDLRIVVQGAEHRIALGTEQGALLPENETVCAGPQYPRGPDEVAKITFYEGGAGGFTVRRRADGALDVVRWSQDDGACPDDAGEVQACPVEEHTIATVPLPQGRRVAESIRLLDARGREGAFDCARGEGR